MLCQNCGRNVEFIGDVCAWCGAPKAKSQLTHMYSYFWGFLGAGVGGYIGYTVNSEVGWLIGGGIGLVLGVIIGVAKGLTALNQNIQCPHCGANLVVDRSKGPNYNCQNCGGIFHLNGAGGGGNQNLNSNRTDCPHCGYKTSFNVAQNPDKYCANCGKRFGG